MTETEWADLLRHAELSAFNMDMLALPDDDVRRGVFADWLQENCPDPQVNEVVRRSITNRSSEPLYLPLPSGVNAHVRRGRLDLQLETNPLPPSDHGCRALWESGWIGGVRLERASTAAVVDWLMHPQMAGVDRLEVISGTVEVAQVLAQTAHLTALRHLDLSACLIGDAGVVALAASPLFLRLDNLRLVACGITVAGLHALAISSRLSEPRALDLDLAFNDFGRRDWDGSDAWPPTLLTAARHADAVNRMGERE